MAEYDPSNTAAYDIDLADENDGEEQYEEAEDSAHVQNDADAEDEDEDYDPSSFNFDEGAGDAQSTELMKDAQSGSPPAPTTATDVPPPTKPKTVGGFLVDDDDEEEEAEEGDESAVQPPLSQLNGTTGAHSGLGDASVAAGSHDVPIASEPQDTAAVLSAQSLRSNGSTPVVPPSASNASPSSIPASAPSFNAQISALPASDQGEQSTPVQSATATPQPPPTISNVPSQPSRQPQPTSSLAPASNTQRLPHDKVGQLEDRIKEDPKGDREAWRTLISHYREKGQLDQARKIYSRFLEVFPSAVRRYSTFSLCTLRFTMSCTCKRFTLHQTNTTYSRLLFGLSMRNWNLKMTISNMLSKFSASRFCSSPMSTCGLCIWTTSGASTRLIQIQMAANVASSPRLSTSSWTT